MYDLERLIEADRETWRPRAVPDFSTVYRRKRARDRRRVAAAVVGATAVLLGAIAIQPALPPGQERLSTLAVPGDNDAAVVYTLRYTDALPFERGAAEAALERCFRLRGVTDVGSQYSLPPTYGVTVEGADNKSRFEDCAAGLKNFGVTSALLESPTSRERLVAPQVSGAAVCYADGGDCSSVLDVDEARKLADQIENAPLATRKTYGCPYDLDPQFVRVTFTHDGGTSSTVEAGLACQNMQSADRQVRAVTDRLRESLRQYAEAGATQRGRNTN